MSSTFGKIFSVTTWGESHGPAVGAVLDGCPAGLPINEEMIQAELNRRRRRQSFPQDRRRYGIPLVGRFRRRSRLPGYRFERPHA